MYEVLRFNYLKIDKFCSWSQQLRLKC